MATRLYHKRVGHKEFDRMIEISRWIEKSFGRPDYHKNYTITFADHTDDYTMWIFFDDTMAFWTQNRWPELLTMEQWEQETGLYYAR